MKIPVPPYFLAEQADSTLGGGPPPPSSEPGPIGRNRARLPKQVVADRPRFCRGSSIAVAGVALDVAAAFQSTQHGLVTSDTSGAANRPTCSGHRHGRSTTSVHSGLGQYSPSLGTHRASCQYSRHRPVPGPGARERGPGAGLSPDASLSRRAGTSPVREANHLDRGVQGGDTLARLVHPPRARGGSQ